MAEQKGTPTQADAQAEDVSSSDVEIGIQVDSEFADRVATGPLLGLVRRTLYGETLPAAQVELGLVIGGDVQIQELNRQFRGVDAPTDVLAFAMWEADDEVKPDPEMPFYLGDVIVSYPRALAQATEAGHPVDEELSLLVVHGVLHLVGYDHDAEEGKARMWARQDALLGKHLVD